MSRPSRSRRRDLLDRLNDGPFAALPILHARRYTEDYPEDVYGWYSLGIALQHVSRFAEAEQALRKALDVCLPEDRGAVMAQLGRMFDDAGARDEAIDWYTRAIEHSPDDASYHIFLGGLLARLGRLAEAEAVHRRGTQCAEGYVDEAYLNLGYVLRAQERFAEAAACFREAIRIDPGYRHARRALRDVELCLKWKPDAPGRG